MIVLMAGLPGSGKSALAEALADARWHRAEQRSVRHALFSPRDRRSTYTTEQDDFVMEVMLQAAGRILQKHPDRVVFLDGRALSAARTRSSASLRLPRG